MKVVIDYQGKIYESGETNDYSADDFAEMFYENFSEMTKFKLGLASGGSVILGERALQSAVIMFIP